MDRVRAAGALIALAACIACSAAAPTLSEHTALDAYDGTTAGCYYNFQHYGEGDRIMTNEPCLNCTCHNRMLMCYLRVCPFTKPIGQDCTVEKRADQCCPIVTCPDVPVDLLTSTSTTSPAEYGATGVGKQDKYGCSINGKYFSEGSKVPPTPNKPCEHCYCIRNMTTCVMQECTLHVDGCTPIYHKDVCCPVRYSCDHPEDEIPLLDDMTTTIRPTPGFLLTTTTSSPVTQMSQDCIHDDKIFADGALIKTEKACEHCYCMKGDIVCVVQECGAPMENEGKNCTSLPPREGQCCPDTYICEGDEITSEPVDSFVTNAIQEEYSTLSPPRRHGVEGSGYRKEPDNISTYTDMPIEESEGSGEGQKMETPLDSNEILLTTELYEPITTVISATEESQSGNEITDIQKTERLPEEQEKITQIPEEDGIDDIKGHELSLGTTSVPIFMDTEAVTKFDDEDVTDKTTNEDISVQEENISTTVSGLLSENKMATKPDLDSTTIRSGENDIKIITDRPVVEDTEGATTESEKIHDLSNDAITEQEGLQTGEYGSSTSSTPFLEEVEKVTTETLGQHIVTDSISDHEAVDHHRHVTSTGAVEEIEPTKESQPAFNDNNIPDTDINEYIPIASSTPHRDESQIGTTVQEGLITSDFTDQDTSTILADNELVTTDINKEITASYSFQDISTPHEYISTTPSSVSLETGKLTTEMLEHDTATDRIKQEDETHQHHLTTPTQSILTQSEITSTEKEKGEKDVSEHVADIEKSVTAEYVSPSASTPYFEDQKTTVQTIDEENLITDKDLTNTIGLSSFETFKEVSTEAIKLEGSSTIVDDKEFYDDHKLATTSALGIDEDYITTTEYLGKDQEFITHGISETAVQPDQDMLNASSTPFLEEVEKASSGVTDDSTFSSLSESVITESEKYISSSYITPTIENVDKTTIHSDNIAYVTPSSTPIIEENLGAVISEKTTQGDLLQFDTTIQPIKATDEGHKYEMDSKTTDAHLYSTILPSSFVTEVDQVATTTESSYRKEDKNVETTSDSGLEEASVMSQAQSSTTIAPSDLPYEIPLGTVHPEYSNESQKPDPLQDSAHRESTEKVNTEITYPTHDYNKIDLVETTTFNPNENEIQEHILPSPGRIPGEGDCLLNGVTYRNESSVPDINKCNSNCRCLSSIVKCDPIICSPPPEYMNNCQPIDDSSDSCCPTYVCDQVRETLPPLPHIHITTPEIPKQSPTIDCHGDECNIGVDNKQATEPTETCTADSCGSPISQPEEISKCGPKGCEKDSDSTAHHIPVLEQAEQCIDGKCEQSAIQIPVQESCTGDNCKSIMDNEDKIAAECSDDLCKKKETLDIQQPCSGLHCEYHPSGSEVPTKDVQLGTYATTADQNAVSEMIPISTDFPDLETKLPETQLTEKDASDETSNIIPDKTPTKLPEFVNTMVQQTDEMKDITPLPNIFITEDQFTTAQEQYSDGLHTLETKAPISYVEDNQTEQPNVVVTESTDLIIGYEDTTEIIKEKDDTKQVHSTESGEIDSDVTKLQDEIQTPTLSTDEITQGTPFYQTPSSLSTTINEQMKQESTPLIDTSEYELTTVKSHEYSTTLGNEYKPDTEISVPAHVTVPDVSDKTVTEKQPHGDGVTSSSDLLSPTENIEKTTQTKEALPSMSDQEITTSTKFETESGLSTPSYYSEQEITNTDIPHSAFSEKDETEFTTEVYKRTTTPERELYETTKFDTFQHETAELVTTEEKYVTSEPTKSHSTDIEHKIPEMDRSSTTLPETITEKDVITTDIPISIVTESEILTTKEDKTISPLLVSENLDKDHEKEYPSFVTASEISQPETQTTTSAATVIEKEKIEEQTPISKVTESTPHFTEPDGSDKIVTVKENIPSVVPVTKEDIEKGEVDETETVSPIYTVDKEKSKPEITSSYTTESVVLKDVTVDILPVSVIEESKTTTNAPLSKVTESVIYPTQADDTRTTLDSSLEDKEYHVETESTSKLFEMETTKTTVPDEQNVKQEFSTLENTEIEPFVTEAGKLSTKLPEYFTEQENIETTVSYSQEHDIKFETSISDKTQPTLPTSISEGKSPTESTDYPTTELKPYEPHDKTETDTTTSDSSLTGDKDKIVTPSPQVTGIIEHLSEMEKTKTTLVADITTVQTISEDLSSTTTDLGLQENISHGNKMSTILPTSETQTITTGPTKTEPSSYDAEEVEKSTTLLISKPQGESTTSSSSYMTVSESYATDIDAQKTTALEYEHSKDQNLYTEDASLHVTKSEHHVTVKEETQTVPTFVVQEEDLKTSSQEPIVTESETYASDKDEIKTTVPTLSASSEISASETSMHPGEQGESQTDNVDEVQTTPSILFAEDGKMKPETSVPYTTESGLDIEKMKTTLPETFIEKETVESGSLYTQVTDSSAYTTEKDQTRTSSPVHTTETEKKSSELPVSYATEADIHTTVSYQTSLLETSKPDRGEIDRETPSSHFTESDAHEIVTDKTKTTVEEFITRKESIDTEASAAPVTDFESLVTEQHKHSTISDHEFTELQKGTTESINEVTISMETFDDSNVQKVQVDEQITTELYVPDKFTEVKPEVTTSSPVVEKVTEIEYSEKVTTGGEISTPSKKIESVTSVIGDEDHYDITTNLPAAGLENEVHHDLYTTEVQKTTTNIPESTYLGDVKVTTEIQHTKLPEIFLDTTAFATTEPSKINITPHKEEKQESTTELYKISTNQIVVTEESGIESTDKDHLVISDKNKASTELPITSISYTDIAAHEHVTESAIPVIVQENLTSEPEHIHKITPTPESLATISQDNNYSSPDLHIMEEDENKLKPTESIIDAFDLSTTQPNIHGDETTKTSVDNFTEKLDDIKLDQDSSTGSQILTTSEPDRAEISSLTPTETTQSEEIKQTSSPSSEKTELSPEVIELEEHTHETILERTTKTPIDEQATIMQSSPETNKQESIPEQTTVKPVSEEIQVKDTTAISMETSSPSYSVEKSTETTLSTEKTQISSEAVDSKPSLEQHEVSTNIPMQGSEISMPQTTMVTENVPQAEKVETTLAIEEIKTTTLKPTSVIVEEEPLAPVDEKPAPEKKPSHTSATELPKPVTSSTHPSEEIPPPEEDGHFPPSGSSGYGGEPDYVEEDQAFGPGTCRYGGKVYVSAQQIPRDDPCDFCFCFRSDIICLQQSCPPPIHGCHEEPIQGFCCPRYECPVSMATTLNVTTTTTTTTTTLPPHFPTHSYKGAAQRRGCQIKGHTYKVGEVVRASSGPCLHCTCGGDGQMKCDPKACTPEPMLRQMIAAAVSAKRRR